MADSTFKLRLFIAICAMVLLSNKGVYAQVNGGYTFSKSSGTYTAISGTTISFGAVTTNWDNNVTSVTIPFTFTFNGVAYTSCEVSTNGFITFGSTAPGAAQYDPIAANGAFNGVAAAMGCDLDNNGIAITYTALGTSPNQTFVIQWASARRWNYGRTTVQADGINFQIILTQTTNTVQFVYGSSTASATGIGTEVGLRGINNSDFIGRKSATSWSATTADAANSDSIITSSTILPASGLTFTFTPCADNPLAIPAQQGFNSTSAPGCWNQQFVSGTKTIGFQASSSNPATTPEEGSDYVFWNSRSYAAGNETRLVSPPIVTTGTAEMQVTFYWYQENSATYNSGANLSEGVTLEYSLDNATWNSVQFFPRQNSNLATGTGQWESEIVDLPAAAGNQSAIYVAFDFLSESGDNCALDNVTIQSQPANDAGVSGFVVPTPLTPSSQLIQTIITNYGTATLTSVTVNWSVDGVAQTPQTFSGLNVAPNGTVTESLGNYTFANGTSANTITASTSLPNAQTDANPSNDSYTTSSLYTALTGTYTVGAAQTFTSITAAVTYANTYGMCGPVIFELTDTAYSASETYPITINNITTATNTLTFEPASGNTATISSSSTTGMFDLNGVSYVTFNGGTGIQLNLVLSSSGNGAYDIQVNNGCLNTYINNCALTGNAGYNVDIEGTGIASTSIQNCNINEYVSGNYILNGVYVNNQSSSINVSNNNIYDFTNSGVQINLSADAATIASNNFWYDGGTATTNQQAIYVLSGSGHKITGNYIGGQSAGGGVAGTPWTNSAAGAFTGIRIAAFSGALNPDTISGNIIQNINLTNTGGPAFYGIYIQAGKAVAGYAGGGNTIGSSNASLGIVNNGDTSAFMEGIWAAGSALTAQYNTIANLSAPSASSVSATGSTVGGIYIANTANGTVLAYNTIYNLTNASPDTVDFSETNEGGTFNVHGIIIKSSANNHTIQNNTIYNLGSTVTSAYYTAVVGIGVDSNGNGTMFNNLIYGLTNTSTATGAIPGIIGIRPYNGVWKIYNNQVILTNGANTNGVTIYGVSDMTGKACEYFYNSIYISGSPNTGAALSSAWDMLNSSTGIILRNNLLYNLRTNSGSASGNNYAIALTVPTAPNTFSSDYNDLYSSGSPANYIGLKGNTGTPKQFSGWQNFYSPGDADSKHNAVYFNQSNPPVSDLTPISTSNCWLFQTGTPIVTPAFNIAVPDDYNNTVRNTTTPDIGAIEFTDSVTSSITISSGASNSTTGITVCAASSVSNTASTTAPGTLTYAWTTPDSYNPGSVAAFTRTVTTAMAGSYVVTVTDQVTCTSTATVTLTLNPQPVFTATGTNVTCNGAANGQIAVSVSTGVAPFIYSTNTGSTFPYSASPITGLSPATYNVEVQDYNGCISASSSAVTIAQPAELTAPAFTKTNVTCNGAANGTITVSTLPTGGTSPYEYSLDEITYQSSTFFSGLANGAYTVTAMDTNGCTATSTSKNITQPSGLTTPVMTRTNITCDGAADGTLTVTTLTTGGTSPYQYSINGGATYQAGTVFSNLGPGTYILTAEDANNCTINSASRNITQPAGLTAPVITSTDVSCNGGSNGVETVSTIPAGGTSPYQYSLNGSAYQSSVTFSGLPAQIDLVTAMDANGCTINSNPDTITQPVALTAPVATATNVTCNGAGNGKVVCTATTGGTSPYKYSINGGAYQSSKTFSNLPPNTYTITAKDANGCLINSNTVTVTEPVVLTAPVISFTNVTCNGLANGTIAVSFVPTGGTTPYQYSLNGGIYQSSISFTSLPPNTYVVTAQDANGCTSTSATDTIAQPAALTAPVITSANITCYGAGNGTVTVSTIPAGGTSPYKYSLDGGTYQTSANFTSLSAGSHSVVAEDANGCISPASNSVTITHPTQFVAPVITFTGVTCNGFANGAVSISTLPTGGTPPYEYSLSGGAYQEGTTFSNLAPAVYKVTVQDTNGCTKTSNSVTVTQPAALTAPVITKTNITCHGAADGIITVSTLPTGGTTPYQYSLNGGVYQSSTVFNSLGTGSYTVTAEDANGCAIISGSKSITQPAVLTAAVISANNVSCNSLANGTVTVSTIPTGGTSPYQYSLNAGAYQSSISFTSLVPNSYKVTTQDANGCTSTSNTVIINQPVSLTAPVITGTNVTCNGSANGIITIATLPGGGTVPYQYSINGSAYQSGTTFAGLTPADYSVTVKDNNGCTINSNYFEITEPTSLVASASNGGPYSPTQTVQLTSGGSGGTGSYTYQWTGMLAFSSTNQNPLIANSTVAMSGNYSVVITDSLGCTTGATTILLVTNPYIYTWTGVVSSDWATPGNWSPASFAGGPDACNANIIIPKVYTNYPVISTAATIGNMFIRAGAQLTLNANLSLCQNWSGGTTTNGLVLGSGLVVFNGNAQQIISASTIFNEILLDNTNGAALETGAQVSVGTALDLKLGNFDASNGTLTFLSASVNQVAIIDNFSSGYQGTIGGSIHAQRYYNASVTYDQHFMGSPVNTPAFTQFGAAGTPGYVIPLANCDESQMAINSPYGRVFSYHESHGAVCGEAQWRVETTGNALNGQGYSILVPNAGTLTLTGMANLNSSYTLSGLTNSNWANTSLQNREMSSGWQLMSNPYLATLNISTGNDSFDYQVQVWHADGAFAGTYQPGIIGNDASIAPFQAFMVHKTNPGGTASFTINATDRVRTAQTFYAQNDNELDITAQNIATGLFDKTTVAFNTHATDGFDVAYDADKFGGTLTRHTLYTLIADKWISRNVLKSIHTTHDIPVGFEPGANGTYSFNFNGLNTFDPTTYIYLEDKQLNVMYNVRQGNYTFSADSADAWQRFVLHFTPPVEITSENATCNTPGTIRIVQPGPANWSYVITDNENNTIASGILNESAPLTATGMAGTYTLTLVDNNNYVVTKSIQINGAPEFKTGFTAPSVAVAQSNVVFTNTSLNATEFLWSFGDGSIVNGTANPAYSYAQPGTYTVTLMAGDSAGCSSAYSQTITISGATDIASVNAGAEINMWSYSNRIYIDFTQLQQVNAVIKIFNILGQQIASAGQTTNTLFQKEINDIDAAYVIVSVKNDDRITTRKLFIVNTR